MGKIINIREVQNLQPGNFDKMNGSNGSRLGMAQAI